MSNGTALATEIAAALAEGSAAVGNGPLRVTIVRQGAATGPSYDPAPGVDEEFQVDALISEYSAMERQSSLIEDTDIKMYVAAGQGVVPVAQDRVRINGSLHAVKTVSPLQPGGQALMYELQVQS